MTRASTVQVAVSIADGAMQMVSPAVFVNAVEQHLNEGALIPSPNNIQLTGIA